MVPTTASFPFTRVSDCGCWPTDLDFRFWATVWRFPRGSILKHEFIGSHDSITAIFFAANHWCDAQTFSASAATCSPCTRSTTWTCTPRWRCWFVGGRDAMSAQKRLNVSPVRPIAAVGAWPFADMHMATPRVNTPPPCPHRCCANWRRPSQTSENCR